jgi:pyruvate dehydrogenase E2 component (dihydrolipoamide acetyltransferase)
VDGEQVSKGEPLMEVETDKATVEVESPASGTLAAVTASPGDEVAVGRAIAVILAAGESAADYKDATVRPPAAARSTASPKARRLAAERGVDLSSLRGTGPGGAILEEDILQAGGVQAGAPTREPALWRAMAENVSRSWREAPHFFVVREIDAGSLVDVKSRQPEGVSYTDLIVKAVATALVRHPRMNGSSPEVNIGLAVAVPDGLVVPVIHGADRLAVDEIAGHRHDVVERMRSGHLRSNDLSGGTFTISNLGMYGVDLFTAIVTDGQAGILAVGRISDRVVARDGTPTVRPAMWTSLSCDHRRVDGARAAEFMQTLVGLFETMQR